MDDAAWREERATHSVRLKIPNSVPLLGKIAIFTDSHLCISITSLVLFENSSDVSSGRLSLARDCAEIRGSLIGILSLTEYALRWLLMSNECTHYSALRFILAAAYLFMEASCTSYFVPKPVTTS